MTGNLFARRTAYVLVLASILLMLAPSTASSQGLVESLLGLFERPARGELAPPSVAYAPPAPLPDPLSEGKSIRDTSGPWVAYCVRLCDGYFFPLSRSFSMSPADQCRSFCPAAKTKVFGGNGINQASAADGSRYASLENALLYRKRSVNNCTCNGRDAFGVARMDATNDPTLRPGDIVATNNGFAAYSGQNMAGRQRPMFTPIALYPGMPSEMRRRLATTKILPGQPAAEPVIAQMPVSTAGAIPFILRGERRAQLSGQP